jgi:catechol 2,3-dioxygenase-like lactoylglutathione lyase family enzyme
MVLHHVSLGTNDLRRAKAFYDPLMSELGLRLIKETERIIAYGLTETVFSIERPVNGERAVAGNGTHLAFHAGRRQTVRVCHAAGLANGGKDEGAPGIRSEYDRNYYAAFLRDPDGNKLEIVTFAAE